jgi:hypothetical protein
MIAPGGLAAGRDPMRANLSEGGLREADDVGLGQRVGCGARLADDAPSETMSTILPPSRRWCISNLASSWLSEASLFEPPNVKSKSATPRWAARPAPAVSVRPSMTPRRARQDPTSCSLPSAALPARPGAQQHPEASYLDTPSRPTPCRHDFCLENDVAAAVILVADDMARSCWRVSCSVSPTPAPIWPACTLAPNVTAGAPKRAGRFPARRSGPPERSSPTTANCSRAPTQKRPGTRA